MRFGELVMIRASLSQRRPGTTKINIKKVREIRSRAAAGETNTAIGKSVGLSRQQVGQIVRRERWGDV